VSDTCRFCEPTAGAFNPRGQHPECALRSVLGGIGHLTDHEHWCNGVGDPDMGLSYRESALRVAAWVAEHGVEAAVAIESAPPDAYGRTMGDAADAGITYGGTFKRADSATNSPPGEETEP
jgi:hypothetical protein